MRSSRSIQLLFLGSALAVVGCGGDQQAKANKPCPPRPDGTPDPNCANNANRSGVRTGGLVIIPGMGGGGANTAAGVASGAKTGSTTTTTKSGVRTGGFGGTGGSSAAASS